MSWSTKQAQEIVEQFWQSGVVQCPDDGGPLKLKLHKLHGGDYNLVAACSVCGNCHELRRGDDPRRLRFRPWTSVEIQQLTRLGMKNRALACPICSTPVERHPAPGLPLVRCVRCGNSNQWHLTSVLPFEEGLVEIPVLASQPLAALVFNAPH